MDNDDQEAPKLTSSVNTPDGAPNWDAGAAGRLREAVTSAGGPSAVSRRSGLSLSTLQSYLSGRDIRLGNLLSLAAACSVTVEWLATGREPRSSPIHPSAEEWDQATTKHGPPVAFAGYAHDRGLFEIVDILALARAIDYVEGALLSSSSKLPTVERARAILLAYDLMQRPIGSQS